MRRRQQLLLWALKSPLLASSSAIGRRPPGHFVYDPAGGGGQQHVAKATGLLSCSARSLPGDISHLTRSHSKEGGSYYRGSANSSSWHVDVCEGMNS